MVDVLLVNASRDVMGARRGAYVDIGTESWVDSQLKRYGKSATRSDNLRAEQTLGDLGLRFHCFLVPLDPYVTIKEIRANLAQTRRTGLEHILNVQFCKPIQLHEHCTLLRRCQADGLVKRRADGPFRWHGIPYRQKHKDMEQIVQAGREIQKIYARVEWSLEKAASRTPLARAWEGFAIEVRHAVRARLLTCFETLVERNDRADGKAWVLEQVQPLLEDTARLCSEAPTDRSARRHGFTGFLDGREISSRMNEKYVVTVNRDAWDV